MRACAPRSTAPAPARQVARRHPVRLLAVDDPDRLPSGGGAGLGLPGCAAVGAVGTEELTDFARMVGVELLVIGAGTNRRDFGNEIRWNQAAFRLGIDF